MTKERLFSYQMRLLLPKTTFLPNVKARKEKKGLVTQAQLTVEVDT